MFIVDTNIGSLYDNLRYWLPIFSAFALAVKGFNSAKKSLTGFMDKILNNHLSHIQAATEQTAQILAKMQKDSEQTTKLLAEANNSQARALESLTARR